MLANFAYLAYLTHGTLVLGVVLGAVKGTLLERCTAVDGGVTSSADLELGELIKLDLNRIVGVTLALSLCLLGLNYTS